MVALTTVDKHLPTENLVAKRRLHVSGRAHDCGTNDAVARYAPIKHKRGLMWSVGG